MIRACLKILSPHTWNLQEKNSKCLSNNTSRISRANLAPLEESLFQATACLALTSKISFWDLHGKDPVDYTGDDFQKND
jgi:hypothetical protein